MTDIDIPIPEIEMGEAQVNVGVVVTLVGAAAFAVGLGLGYLIGKRDGKVVVVPPEPDSEQLSIFDLDIPEVASTKYVRRPLAVITTPTLETDNELKRDIEERVNQLVEERLAENEYVGEDEIEQEEALVTNIFAVDDTWDFEWEMAHRKPNIPYVIHQDEFMADEMDFNQETLTYYEGDDILADADDTPIYDYKGMMGELDFGHGTNDPNVVYIRNEVLHMEWEILRHTGRFEQEVLGLAMEKEAEDELRHSVLKFRED